MPAVAKAPKAKKQRVVIDPSNVIPFEVSPAAMVYYKDDDYKYLLHYFRSFPEGRVPIAQYLLIRFHPLIIKTAGHYFSALDTEWRDLISFTRQKFIELLYRFTLTSSLYFRTYIQTALRRAVYDRVLYESRRKSLIQACSLDKLHENPASYLEHKELTVEPDHVPENFTEILNKLATSVEQHKDLTKEDKEIFKLKYLENCSLSTICSKLSRPSFNVVARLRHIRVVLSESASQYV